MNNDNSPALSSSFPIVGIGASAGGLRENPKEAELLPGQLLIGVTRFFRDPQVWEQVKRDAQRRLQALVTDPNTTEAGHDVP